MEENRDLRSFDILDFVEEKIEKNIQQNKKNISFINGLYNNKPFQNLLILIIRNFFQEQKQKQNINMKNMNFTLEVNNENLNFFFEFNQNNFKHY